MRETKVINNVDVLLQEFESELKVLMDILKEGVPEGGELTPRTYSISLKKMIFGYDSLNFGLVVGKINETRYEADIYLQIYFEQTYPTLKKCFDFKVEIENIYDVKNTIKTFIEDFKNNYIPTIYPTNNKVLTILCNLMRINPGKCSLDFNIIDTLIHECNTLAYHSNIVLTKDGTYELISRIADSGECTDISEDPVILSNIYDVANVIQIPLELLNQIYTMQSNSIPVDSIKCNSEE